MRKKLITFGCSWTWGVGAYYQQGDYITEEHHWDMAWNSSSINNAARSILSRKYNLKNVNFAKRKRSNNYNFRKLREYVIAHKEDIIILFGITSTARNEYYIPADNKYQFIKYNSSDADPAVNRFFLKHYDHDHEIKLLTEQIITWNDLLEYYKIPIIWYDTFNTHEYYQPLRNFIPNGDLLTQILNKKNIKYNYDPKWYHLSSWKNEDPRITAGIKHGLLNPISYHPSKLGQELIAEIIEPYLSTIIARPDV